MGVAVVVAGGNIWRMNLVALTPVFWSRCKPARVPRKQTPLRHLITFTGCLGQRS